jgi:hypothetical protein
LGKEMALEIIKNEIIIFFMKIGKLEIKPNEFKETGKPFLKNYRFNNFLMDI